MAALDSGPCAPWEAADCQAWPENLEPAQEMAMMAATEILWNRTHRRFGLCEVTLRPCRQSCWPDNIAAMVGGWLPTWGGSGGWGWPFPTLLGGRWYNLGCGMCGDNCSCTTLHQIELPQPVAEIIEVKVDGQVLVTGAYRVDDWRYLVRLDGEPWPLCNDLNEPDTEEGTWSVTATYGEVVPVLGGLAVNQLALEIAKACIGGANCNLPGAVVKQIARQGVTKDLTTGSWLAGWTSLASVNSFLETYNPAKNGVALIYDIDGKRARRVNT